MVIVWLKSIMNRHAVFVEWRMNYIFPSASSRVIFTSCRCTFPKLDSTPSSLFSPSTPASVSSNFLLTRPVDQGPRRLCLTTSDKVYVKFDVEDCTECNSWYLREKKGWKTKAGAVLISDVDTDSLHSLIIIYLFIELFNSERLVLDNINDKIWKCIFLFSTWMTVTLGHKNNFWL